MPPQPFDMYSITKVAQEHTARMLSRRFEIPTLIARIFNIAGPGQDERHFCGHLASQIVAIERQRCPAALSVGPLTSTRDFIDVRDVADGLMLLSAVQPEQSTCNLASGRETAMQEVFDNMLALSRIQQEVSIERKPGRKADMPRNVASMETITAWGFRPAYELSETLSDILGYYRSLPDNG
jgi:GDP-4-dehydro-6-deoxy-D-mannose reductase